MKTNVRRGIKYEYMKLQRDGRMYHGCVSDNFMESDDDKIISVERLFQAYKGQSAARAILAYDEVIDRIRYVAKVVENTCGFSDFGRYLREIISLDALFLNEDRHFHNLAVICRKDGSFRECPIFDNGAALFSDVKGDYPLSMTAEECMKKVTSKPFSRNFDEQLDACELAFPAFPFHAEFSIKDVISVLNEFQGIYEGEILQRVEDTMRMQIRKYAYMFS